MKKFLKLLVTSAAYRQTSKVTPELQNATRTTGCWPAGPRFRLSAETVRDQAAGRQRPAEPRRCTARRSSRRSRRRA